MFKALESMGVMLVFVWHPKTPRQLIPWYDYQQKTLNEKSCLGLEIINLLPGGSNSAPFHKFKLAQLREQQNLTQQELATRVGSTQSEISRAEQRDDCLVSTLERYIVGLGGKLLIDIKIDGHLYPITLCDKKGGARITVRRRGKRARVT